MLPSLIREETNMKRFITLDDNNKVIIIREGNVQGVNEIESDTGEMGQILQSDGTFITPEPEVIEPTPTVEDRLANIEDTQDLILLKLEGVIA